MLENWIVILSFIGLADAFWTALQQKNPELFQFCFTPKFKRVDCRDLLHGKYASLFKVVPNSWVGCFAYLFFILYYSNVSLAMSLIGSAYLFGALAAMVGTLTGYYLVYVQARILRTFCIFCLASTTILTVITVLAWLLV